MNPGPIGSPRRPTLPSHTLRRSCTPGSRARCRTKSLRVTIETDTSGRQRKGRLKQSSATGILQFILRSLGVRVDDRLREEPDPESHGRVDMGKGVEDIV